MKPMTLDDAGGLEAALSMWDSRHAAAPSPPTQSNAGCCSHAWIVDELDHDDKLDN